MAYETYRQRVRRHRRTDIVVEVAALSAQLQRAEFGQEPPLGLPNFVQPFALGGVARTALVSCNDHRDVPVTRRDVVEMCALYANVNEPAFDTAEPWPSRMRFFLNHVAYEQFGHQYSAMENVGRTLVLLADHAGASAVAPSAADWQQALGVPLELFMRLGFAMHVAALQNGGSIDRSVLKMDQVAQMFTPLTADDALAIIDRWFAGTPETLRDAGQRDEAVGAEKWSLSPLVARPLVALADGRYVIPWPRLVLDRITPTGLYFIGFDEFGRSFPESLGAMFEEYVGAQLGLLGVDVKPEVVYGRSRERTVDYFLITPELVVLIEVKAARPIRATRLGEPLGDEDTAKKVGHAFGQIERTTRLIRDGHPALAGIPTDRPLRGLVVTLEPFHLVNSRWYDEVFVRPSIPTTVASAHELEATVATLRGLPDVGRRLLDTLTPKDGAVANLVEAAEGLPNRGNPLLEEAWDRFTQPWSDLAEGVGVCERVS